MLPLYTSRSTTLCLESFSAVTCAVIGCFVTAGEADAAKGVKRHVEREQRRWDRLISHTLGALLNKQNESEEKGTIKKIIVNALCINSS